MAVGTNKPSAVCKGRTLRIKPFCAHNAIAISFTAHIQIFLALHKAAGYAIIYAVKSGGENVG